MLTPYEAEVALDNAEPWWLKQGVAPGRKHALSDGLLRQGRWVWSSSYHKQTSKSGKPKRAPVRIELTT